MADATALSFHDEPFVIDNCPLGIDIGEKHATSKTFTKVGDSWFLLHSDLDGLLVLAKTGKKVGLNKAVRLTRKPIVFELHDEKRKKHGTLTLFWEFDRRSLDGSPMPKLRMKPYNFDFDAEELGIDKRRFKQKDDTNFRISKISGDGLSEPIPLEVYDSVFAIFHATLPKDEH
jgi:hypothetical protein